MKSAILLVNLGTPDAPTTPAVRRYLREFLSDPRVVEIPRIVWWFILNLVILPIRASKSAAKYASIWRSDGSPLAVWTSTQAKLLRGLMGVRGHAVMVDYAMRYGNPSIASALTRLADAGFDRILVLPLYPQYSASTTASTFDAVQRWSLTRRDMPEFRFVKDYHDDPNYIEALAARIVASNARDTTLIDASSRLVMSFHGIPQRSIRLGDPYQTQCLETARLLAARLGLEATQWTVSFQSRFGKAAWLEPYTVDVLNAFGGKRQPIAVCCPGFPGDCLETLEEIAIEGREIFEAAGGTGFRYIPCMNDDPRWIEALAQIAERHLQGWD